MKNIQAALVDIFNEDIYSSKLSKRVNMGIVFLIVLSTLEIILETEPSLVAYNQLFDLVFYSTSFVFLAEIIIRFYISAKLNTKYAGFIGKIRFGFDFYNFIDLLSILPFVLGFFGLEVLVFLKALRVFRIVKILRYLPAIDLLKASISNKKNELLVSFETILILSLLLSIGLYYAECDVDGTRFSSISQALLWSVAKFIGDIGGYGDFVPDTAIGKILATLNGLLGIAIFAVPAGIIGSGFVEEIEERQNQRKYQKSIGELKDAFQIEYFTPAINIKKKLGLSHVPRKWLSMDDIRYKMRLSESDVFSACQHSNYFRLRNVKFDGVDKAGLEYVNINTTYGQLIDRDSKLTIMNLYPSEQPFFGHFTMCMADILSANYISNELYSIQSLLSDNRQNLIKNDFYTGENEGTDIIHGLIADVESLIMQHTDSTLIFMVNASSVGNDRLLQFNTGGEKESGSIEGGTYFNNNELLNQYFSKAKTVASQHEMTVEAHVTAGKFPDNHIVEYLAKKHNCQILALHLNVGVLKKKINVYYQTIADVASIFQA
jgi:voltage-gated potassium channel